MNGHTGAVIYKVFVGSRMSQWIIMKSFFSSDAGRWRNGILCTALIPAHWCCTQLWWMLSRQLRELTNNNSMSIECPEAIMKLDSKVNLHVFVWFIHYSIQFLTLNYGCFLMWKPYLYYGWKIKWKGVFYHPLKFISGKRFKIKTSSCPQLNDPSLPVVYFSFLNSNIHSWSQVS